MAETKTSKQAESDKGDQPLSPAGPETRLSVKTMAAAGITEVRRRVFYFIVFLLSLWIVLTLVTAAVEAWT